ncbi:MAG: ABC transporter permease subunit, partial [Actinomycetota bacterium]
MDWGFIFERTFSAVIGVEVMVYALAAVGLNVHFGYTGLMNFGQAGFMAAGAYGIGVTVYWMQWSFWWGVLFVFVYGAVLALLLGIPTLRLRADYLS